jgi:2-hydroxy-3-keto-5-methylthiopentenyl-1-phosphate phosphatase
VKKYAFVSDFDGTLTSRDFYHIIIDKYLGDWGNNFYTEWKKNNKINVEFLNKIFGSISLAEVELHDEIVQIPIDEFAVDFIKKVKESNGDFFIVSAGTSYYIKILLSHLHVEDVNVVSMEGIYSNGGIKIVPDEKSIYYSNVFGLDKQKVVENLRKEHEYIIFAGDSEPDFRAAKAADMVYARGELSELLMSEGIPYTPFTDFKQIEKDLIDKGWIRENSNT